MPNLIGLSYKDAINILKLMKVEYMIEGTGYVTTQSISEGTKVTEGNSVKITLSK